MIAIKDFDIPSCCSECQMASCKGLSGQFYCDITTYDVDMDDTKRDADCPLVEAIPKADYENRLKADMVAMLTEIQLEIDELEVPLLYLAEDYEGGVLDCKNVIQQKINALKAEGEG